MVSEMGVVEVGNLIQISMIYIIGLMPNKFLFFILFYFFGFWVNWTDRTMIWPINYNSGLAHACFQG